MFFDLSSHLLRFLIVSVPPLAMCFPDLPALSLIKPPSLTLFVATEQSGQTTLRRVSSCI
ncbi:hypothetical protein BC827DRAFT_801195 [Russula dissimulans]|nr:hypothetical protein BC827DRAFT_801195 [Russula dissimulans]